MQLNAFETNGSSPPRADILFHDHGSVVLITPTSRAGDTWLADNVANDGFQPYPRARVCDRRFVFPIWEGAQRDGLRVAVRS